LPEKSREGGKENPGSPRGGRENERGDVAIPANGIKSVVSIRMDKRTIETLDRYAKSIDEKMSTVARGFIVEGLEKAGVGMSSDELHELTRLRMKEELSRAAGKRISKVVRVGDMRELKSARRDLEYWLSRPAEERVAAVDFLRRQHYGDTARLQRVAGVVQRS
jgi:hypothetical protein